eukprot:TRINITY_DN997_c0_g1_i1.p2 TRINITY_DN997_c0_g1~~TRINITY_DN997_c0_g1_i1.p2  ORF type:complete len:75 (-),score=17.77 TRINITY_DN997_c0_g1_i1:3-227(-)
MSLSGTRKKCTALVSEFSGCSQILLTNPEDSEALVELTKYTKKFKRQKLHQLRNGCAEVNADGRSSETAKAHRG